MKRFLFLFFSLAVSLGSLAQKTGSITGFVVDKLSQQPLEGATLTLEGTVKATVADSMGKFRLSSIPVNS